MDTVRFSWRNLLSLTLVLIFAPVSIASAMPVVWCSAPGGYEAVELSHRSAQHDHHIDHEHDAADTHAETDGCRDRQLMEASKLAQADLDGIIPFSERVVLPLPALPIARAMQRARQAEHPPAHPNSVRAALRSVILLI